MHSPKNMFTFAKKNQVITAPKQMQIVLFYQL